MKKLISFIVVFVIVLSLPVFMTNTVSANTLNSTYEDAKDGDLLYEVKFGETSGVYMPTQFNAQQEGDTGEGAVTITDDGRTLAYYKPSLQSKTSFYGGQIEGLTWGEGKTYTITMKLSLPRNRGGVYFNFPSELKKAELTGETPNSSTYNTVMYGLYGRFTPQGDMGAMLGMYRTAGRYRFDDPSGSYKEFNQLLVEEGTFLDVVILVEDYAYAIFVDNMFLDVIDLTEEAVKGVCDNLGLSVYMYHVAENKPLIVKDVNVYKGDIISLTADYPLYAGHGSCPDPDLHKTSAQTVTSALVTDTSAPIDTTVTNETTGYFTEADPETSTKNGEKTTKTPPVITIERPVQGGEGCSSVISSGVAVIAIVSLAGVAMGKKRR